MYMYNFLYYKLWQAVNIFKTFIDQLQFEQLLIFLSKSETARNTVKPVLTATSEQRLPANNGQPKPGQIKFNSNFDWKPFKKWPPMYNGHYSGVPRVAVVDRFDCTHTADDFQFSTSYQFFWHLLKWCRAVVFLRRPVFSSYHNSSSWTSPNKKIIC
jgi:hypothetical protein